MTRRPRRSIESMFKHLPISRNIETLPFESLTMCSKKNAAILSARMKRMREINNLKYLNYLHDFLRKKSGKTISQQISNLRLTKLYIDKMLEKLEERKYNG